MDMQAMEQLLREQLEILVSKNREYGSQNLLRTGAAGVATRVLDKANRAVTLTQNGIDPKFESLEDTFTDITNYGVIGKALLRGLLTDKPVMLYLAGPIDRTTDPAFANEWREELAKRLPAYFTCFNPFTAFRGGHVGNAAGIEAVNRAAITACDVLVANLSSAVLAFGTIREIEFAKSLGKPVVVISHDLDKSISAHDLELVHDLDGVLEFLRVQPSPSNGEGEEVASTPLQSPQKITKEQAEEILRDFKLNNPTIARLMETVTDISDKVQRESAQQFPDGIVGAADSFESGIIEESIEERTVAYLGGANKSFTFSAVAGNDGTVHPKEYEALQVVSEMVQRLEMSEVNFGGSRK